MPFDAKSFAGEWSAKPEHITTSRHEIAQWLNGASLEPDLALGILLAVCEAVTNAIEHGSRFDATKPVSVQATMHGESLTITVNDRGCWIEPANQPPSLGQQRGRGMHLINELAADVDMTGSALGTQITMRFDLREQTETPHIDSISADLPLATPGAGSGQLPLMESVVTDFPPATPGVTSSTNQDRNQTLEPTE